MLEKVECNEEEEQGEEEDEKEEEEGEGGEGVALVGESKYGRPGHKTSPAARPLADKYSHFPQNKSNSPANNKYGWWSLLNRPATPGAAFGRKTPK